MNDPSVLRRLIHALFITGFAILGAAGFLGLRAYLWGRAPDVVPAMLSGVTTAALAGAALGLLYVIFGSGQWTRRYVDIFAIEMGALIGVIVYGLYSAISLALTNPSRDLLRAGLQGALDGAVIGAGLGLGAGFLSGRPLELTRVGCGRFLVLLVIALLLAAALIAVTNAVPALDALLAAAGLGVFVIGRGIVALVDRARGGNGDEGAADVE